MPRCVPVLAALLCSIALSDDVFAQARQRQPVGAQASAGLVSGVVGLVTDDAGRGIDGVSILAMGSTLAVARTDQDGRFRLELAPGPYILRATRDGYVSTYREAVHVRTDAPLTRTITLLRAADVSGDVVLASMTQPIEAEPDEDAVSEAPRTTTMPSEVAWRLRHLPRTALRDVGATWDREPSLTRGDARESLTLADFNAQVDFLTTSALAASGELPTRDWPRGVAYVVVGAPVGPHGDWTVRASVASGEASAWTLTGEYVSRNNRAHAFRAGVSYSAQTLPDRTMDYSLAAIDTVRRVGGVRFSDHWTVGRGLEVDSSLRVDRFEYLAEPTLISAHVGLRQRVAPRMFVVAVAAPHMIAPGADQFAPPASTGVWLPPERTFSALADTALHAQRVESYEAGTDFVLRHAPSDDGGLSLRVRRFREESLNQIATVFGLDEASQVGHYYFGSPGDVVVDGWLVGVFGRFGEHINAAVDYRVTQADWVRGEARFWLRDAELSAARGGFEQLHDVTATVEATVPSTATRVNAAVRVNSGFSRKDAVAPEPGARFAIEVRQQLPGRPLGRGELNLLVSARTLLHEFESVGYYNELLTVAPPVRLTCGLQMRF